MKRTLIVAMMGLGFGFGLRPSAQQPAPAAPASPVAALAWRQLGPANTGGRVTAIDGRPGDPTTFFVGAADGGIWKTTNAGTTFRPVFDHEPVLSIGALAIAPSDPNVVWAGTGEGNPRNSVSFGDGVYRSTDAGETWTHLGLDDTERIARIRVDPRDPDVAYVAALGHEWGASEERGLFKTIDGGKTWKKVLYLDRDTGCSDVELDPSNPRIVYAGMYTFRRRPWRFDSGGGQTGLYRSMDGGATWTHLTGGLPKQPQDRIGIAVAPSQPSTVYMVTEFKDAGVLFRSDDRGDTWQMVHKDPQIVLRPFYFGVVRVDPRDPQRVYVLGGNLWMSRDGGRTFQRHGGDIHSDHHALWIDPTNPKRMLNGDDGGLYQSWDGGETFEYLNVLPLSQFYHLNYDLRQPYYVCGGLQDNFNWCGPSRTTLNEGIRLEDWQTLTFGDGFFAVPDPREPYLVYSDTQGGVIAITDTRTGGHRQISPYPARLGSAGEGIADHKYRYNWNSPIVLSPKEPGVVYFGANVLFRSTDHGDTWTEISPDLTTNDKAKQQSSGGDISNDNTAAEFHCTIIAIAPSPIDPKVIWVGTDDGNVQVTRDGGKTWTNVVANIQGLPANAWIPAIDASHFDAGTAYVAVDRHQDDDFAPYGFKTADYGRTWTAIRGDLPAKGYLHVIREDPKSRSLLYAGTELGVFGSWDAGAHWTSIRNNLPPVAVRDLQIHPRDNDLIAGTHGRGAWILDDLAPLQQLADARQAEEYLFDLRPAVRYQMSNTNVFVADRHFAGENPPYGASISYYLRTAPKEKATITVTDRAGRTIRTMHDVPSAAGVNRTAWDLRYDPPTPPRAGAGGGRGGGRVGAAGGPLVVPDEYTVTLAVNGRALKKTVRVEPDPRAAVLAADLTAQRDALLSLRELASRLNRTVDQEDDLIKQLTDLQVEMKEANPESFRTIQRALDDVRTVRGPLTRLVPTLGYRFGPGLREEIGSLTGGIGATAAAPTPAQLKRLKELQAETDKAESALKAILGTRVPEVNRVISGQPRIIVK